MGSMLERPWAVCSKGHGQYSTFERPWAARHNRRSSSTDHHHPRTIVQDPPTQYRLNRKEYRIERLPRFYKRTKKIKMPLFGELSRASLDSFESESDSNESKDVRLSLPKSGILIFVRFSTKILASVRFDRFDIPFVSIDIASECRGGLPW